MIGQMASAGIAVVRMAYFRMAQAGTVAVKTAYFRMAQPGTVAVNMAYFLGTQTELLMLQFSNILNILLKEFNDNRILTFVGKATHSEQLVLVCRALSYLTIFSSSIILDLLHPELAVKKLSQFLIFNQPAQQLT